MIRVVVVDDSPVIREYISYILGRSPNIEVVGTAENGQRAIRTIQFLRPDVVTMDIEMPEMDGLQATREIMATNPTRIAILTGAIEPNDMRRSFDAIAAGAMVVLHKPAGIGTPEADAHMREIIESIEDIATQQVRGRSQGSAPQARKPAPAPVTPTFRASNNGNIQLMAVGSSTGGPSALKDLLYSLPADINFPVVIAQHIANGFLSGLVNWLSGLCQLPIHIAKDGQQLQPGHVYFAPETQDLLVEPTLTARLVEPRSSATINISPSASRLFASAADAFQGRTIGVLLTGMGEDGAQELGLIKNAGGPTFAQNEETCTVFGMPGEAIRLNHADFVLSPEGIAKKITALINP